MATYTMKDFINENIAVRVGKKHYDEFMKMCEKESLKWFSGTFATVISRPSDKDNLSITCGFHCAGDLEWCDDKWYENHGWKVIDFEDFIGTPTSRYQIIIECNGDTTTAKMTINGKETKVATAKRNPTDKFDWKKGASLAFERLWDKTPVKKDGEFKVGDRVVVVNNAHVDSSVLGLHGTVRYVMTENVILPFAVEFDTRVNCLHICGGKIPSGKGHWLGASNLRHEDSTPKTKKVKEVKRQAKVGEYVRIDNPITSHLTRYEKGDILRVLHVDTFGRVKLSCGGDIALDREYVVLEGYEPGMEV